MRTSPIPSEVQEFIRDCITSALQVEVLLLLAEDKQTEWIAADIGAKLRSNPAFIAIILAEFHSLGLLWSANDTTSDDAGREVRYRYQPSSPELERTIDTLARVYRDRRHNVLAAIYSPPEPDPLQAFSDAFRFNRAKPREEGD